MGLPLLLIIFNGTVSRCFWFICRIVYIAFFLFISCYRISNCIFFYACPLFEMTLAFTTEFLTGYNLLINGWV
ncbi:hypothetical protein V1520DRAFT_138709 [Lipomyces starkeyi]